MDGAREADYKTFVWIVVMHSALKKDANNQRTAMSKKSGLSLNSSPSSFSLPFHLLSLLPPSLPPPPSLSLLKGPYFAPPYEPLPEDVQLVYDGQPMKLSSKAEEAAGFFGKMLDHEYTSRDTFCTNFFQDWRKVCTSICDHLQEKDVFRAKP